MRFQYDELSSAKLQVGEQELLEAESETLNHAEEIKSALYEADNTLNGDDSMVQHIRLTVNSLRNIEKVFPAVGELAERMEEYFDEFEENGIDNVRIEP